MNNLQNYILIKDGQIVDSQAKIFKSDILIQKDKILGISKNISATDPNKTIIIDAKNKIITSGLIEQHIHGCYGVDFNTASDVEIVNLMEKLPRHGITSIIPTIMTAPLDVIQAQIEKIKNVKKILPINSTQIEGIHIEGPCLCSQYKGIHPEKSIVAPSVENFKIIEDELIKIVSYSPELDEDFKLTKYLAERNVIPSAGHTNSSYETIREAVKYGLRQVTHLFNAMNPLNHRNPGVIGESLTNDNLYVEVIADGLHLNPIIIDIILRTKPESKILFISDCLPLNKAESDTIMFGGQQIYNKDGKAVNAEGTFAGSLMLLNSIIKQPHNLKLAGFEKLIKFSSSNVADNLGLENRGYIKANNKADLVIWDKDYTVNTTIINGHIAFIR